MKQYDVVIIGGGLGGLACGAILSREGMNICIVEQHKVIGGCLQSFNRKGHVLDTGMHYVGSLSEGQIMRQYFRYFGIEKKLRLNKLDEEAFDVICFKDDKPFYHAMGYDRFAQTLIDDFPDEYKGIAEYCNLLRKVGGQISPEILRQGNLSSNLLEYMGMSIYEEIARNIKNPKLRSILAGSNVLYGRDKNKSSIYEHCMINHSNIEGAHNFMGGTQHIADAFVDVIRENGGEIFNSAQVSKIRVDNNKVSYIEINGTERFFAQNVISSTHPAHTLSLLENNTTIKKAFFSRIQSLGNSFGLFTTYLIMKPESWKYQNRNYYLYNTNDAWSTYADYKGVNITSVLMSMQLMGNNDYTNVITLLTPVHGTEFAKWEQTKTGKRGDEYEELKHRFSETMIDFVSQWFPDLKSCIESVYTASPLTYRDYTSTPNGSAYGIIKDYHNPIVSHLPAQTKISNLYFTGQNLNVHGCIGVSVTAAVTCGELLGTEYLAKKIGNA